MTQVLDRGRDRRRHAVAVDRPPRRQVAQEAPPVGGVEPAPHLLDAKAHAVDDGAPIAILAIGGTGEADRGADQLAERRAVRKPRHVDRVGARGKVAAGDETVTRYRRQTAGVATMPERQDLVDHRQAGADEEHAGVVRDRPEAVVAPRVGDHRPARGVVDRLGSQREVGRLMAKTQRDHRSEDSSPGGEPDLKARLPPLERYGGAFGDVETILLLAGRRGRAARVSPR